MLTDLLLADSPESTLPAWRIAAYVVVIVLMAVAALVVRLMWPKSPPRHRARHTSRWWRRDQVRPVEVVTPRPLPDDAVQTIELPARPYFYGNSAAHRHAQTEEEVSW